MSVRIEIEYCDVWNYYPKAAGLAEKIKNILNIETQLIESKGGAFEVFLNKEKIYSKLQTGIFPDEEKLINMLKQKL